MAFFVPFLKGKKKKKRQLWACENTDPLNKEIANRILKMLQRVPFEIQPTFSPSLSPTVYAVIHSIFFLTYGNPPVCQSSWDGKC